MMNIEKPAHIYKAIAEALKSWGDRHYINARGHMADALGLRGVNAARQLSNILNYKTYNPIEPKAMKLGQLQIILEELDTEDVVHILSAMGEPFGLSVVERSVPTLETLSFHRAVDATMIGSCTVFNVTKEALTDDTLSQKELEAIICEINKEEAAYAKLKQMAKTRLKEIKEGE